MLRAKQVKIIVQTQTQWHINQTRPKRTQPNQLWIILLNTQRLCWYILWPQSLPSSIQIKIRIYDSPPYCKPFQIKWILILEMKWYQIFETLLLVSHQNSIFFFLNQFWWQTFLNEFFYPYANLFQFGKKRNFFNVIADDVNNFENSMAIL